MAVASDHHEGSLQEEVELLEAIYIHELTLEGPKDRPSSVSLLLHPSTGDEGEKQYVCLTLQVFLPEEYPSTLPAIHIKNPRGLSDAHVESIISNLRELAENRLGSPMLYELIEYAKESLTDNNIPSCACAICLSHFQDSHCFTKTECYHYYHCTCLARYIEYSLKKRKEHENLINNSSEQEDKQIVCPMCRLPITYDLDALKAAPEDVTDDEISYSPDKKMKRLQKNMAELFNKQFKNGGIINVEEERNKYLIEIKKAPVSHNTEGAADGDSCPPQMDPDLGKSTSANGAVDQSTSKNHPGKVNEERRRERPSSSRRNRERDGKYYRNDGRWDGRNERPWNDRPPAKSCHERGFYKGQRNREVNPITQGTRVEHRGEHRGNQRNQARKTSTEEKMGGENKTVPKENKEGKSNKDVGKDNLEQGSAVENDQLKQPSRNNEATLGLGSRNDDKTSAIGATQRDVKDRKRTDSGYRVERRDRTTRSAGKKENISSHSKDLSQRENNLDDHKHRIRYKNTDATSVNPSKPSEETSGKVFSDDKRRKGQKGTKTPEHKYRDRDIPVPNESGGKYLSKKDFDGTKPALGTRGELSCVENVLQSNPKIDNKSTAGIVKPPPGFDKIKKNFRGPISPPPGFENNDSLVGKPSPPGF